MAASEKTEVHHHVPRSLLSVYDRAMARAELDGAALQLWIDFEEECHRCGVSPDLSREELESVVESSAAEVSYEEHRFQIHAADWSRWGRLGGLKVLELYGPAYFEALAKRRWRKISAEELDSIRASILVRGAA
jgi:hypothetical protein